VAPKVLTGEVIKRAVSQLGRTYDGTSFAFVRLDITDREIEYLNDELANYQHLRYLEFGGNSFNSIDVLAKLPYALRINLKGNRVSSLSAFQTEEAFQFLQHLELTGNQVPSLVPLSLPRLLVLNLNQNAVRTCENFTGHPTLTRLTLKGNQLKSLVGLKGLPALTELCVAENEVKSLVGLEDLPALKRLHLRKNAIESFELTEDESLPDLPALEYLNLTENKLTEVKALRPLSTYGSLRSLNLKGTPLGEELADNAKKEVLIVLSRLAVINKEEVTTEDREDAVAEAAERHRIAEEAKLEAERLAREAEEEANRKDEEES
jgi:Leucine-rich repeat (LRR) protein